MKRLDRIRSRARQDPKCKFTSLAHLVNEENLKDCFSRLTPGKAAGIDGVTKEEYNQDLDNNIKGLVERLKSKTYRASPVRRVLIPKPGKDEKRILGIPTIEDKMLQSNVKEILESIYEAEFLDHSYGFRVGRSCHDAIKALDHCVMTKRVNYVVEVDIHLFFDTVSHNWMMRCLKEKIKDPNFLWMIERFLKAGVMESGNFLEVEQGTPQGGVASPVLANIYLHYILDLWFEKIFKLKCQGYSEMIRYCDDFVVCFESEKDAYAFMDQLKVRLEKFGLQVAPEKTRVIKFGKQEWYRTQKSGTKCSTFNFLGFTHYGRKSRKGHWIMGHKTTKENLSRKLKEITEYIKSICNKAQLKEWWPIVQAKLRGHINYFGISGNLPCVEQFIYQVRKIAFKWINRRSQKKSMDWRQFNTFLDFNPLPQARITYSFYVVK